jgi:methionyl-tRNA formyltransferase
LRLVFAGTPPFAAQALGALHAAGHDVALVLTQPDRPSGRGLRPKPSAVAELAADLGLAIAKPSSLKATEARAPIEAAAPDLMVVAAYGLILPESVLAIPRKGCLNIHASLLPRWRGAAPIQRAIQAGDAETGVAIMVMEAGLDTGPVLLERRVPILATDNAGTLTDKLAGLGADAIVEALGRLDSLEARRQEAAGATYAAKIAKAEAALDWEVDAIRLGRQVRAFNPFPGAEAVLDGQSLKVWEAEPVEGSGRPGTVIRLDQGRPVIACGHGALVLTVIQRPGSRRMAAEEFLKGRPMPPGTQVGPARAAGA